MTSETMPPKLGKYALIREISRGCMGIVYLAHDPFANRTVAIKVLRTDTAADPAMQARQRKLFFNEAQAAGRLTHPNIVQVFDAGTDGDYCYLVMEYVEGGQTLKPYCKSSNLLPVEVAAEIVFKCATALDYAHRRGVLHRDIKPGNLLLKNDYDVKIGDFSIAQLTHAETTVTSPQGIVGSPLYMSPEQVSEEQPTQQSDLFSLGVVFYEILTGQHPFSNDNFSRLVYKILNEDPKPVTDYRPSLPDGLAAVVSKTLQRDLTRRYRMGAEMAEDLRAIFPHLERPQDDIAGRERFNALRSLEFFTGFPDVEVWELVRSGIWERYESGQCVFAEGDIVDSFYVITAGEISVSKGGTEIVALGVGDCFGEMGYLARTKRTATVSAKGHVDLIKLNEAVVSRLSLNCQVRFLKVFLRTLIHRLSVTTEQASRVL